MSFLDIPFSIGTFKKKIAYNEVKLEILIDWIVFKAVSAIFQPCNGGTGKMGK